MSGQILPGQILWGARDRAGRAVGAAERTLFRYLSWLPGWAQALVVYALARLVSALITLAVARWQAANLWTSASPGYEAFTGDLWDSSWYQKIAAHGYPLPLPRGADGVVQQSEWAFFPAYPFIVRALMAVSGGSWELIAPTTSLLLGAVAALGLHRVFTRVAGARAALGGVLLVAVFPSAPVLQYAYTESLALCALAWALAMLVERRYGWCALAVLLLGASRAVALPFVLVVLAHGVARHRSARHTTPARPEGGLRRGSASGDPFGVAERTAVAALALVCVAAGVAWPLLVGELTGVPHAYTLVQGAWRSGPVRWFVPWWTASQTLLGPVAGPVVLLVGVAGFAWWLTSRGARALGAELPAWSLAYGAYLLAVVDPWTSIFRFLILAAPLGLLLASTTRSRAHLLTWAAASIALQVVWVAWVWRFSPPSDYPP